MSNHELHRLRSRIGTNDNMTLGSPSRVKASVKSPADSSSFKQVPVLSGSSVPKRRPPYTRQEWSKIRPIFENLYIDMDMTLQEVMQVIGDKHGFRPT